MKNNEERKPEEKIVKGEQELLDLMTRIKRVDFGNDDHKRRVAVYYRTAVDDGNQSAYDLQKSYFENYIRAHPAWELVGFYEDKGVSGLSMKNRSGFDSLIKDCETGKIDFVIAKNVSRLSRDIISLIEVLRKLARLTPPVGVYFITEGIYSLSVDDVIKVFSEKDN